MGATRSGTTRRSPAVSCGTSPCSTRRGPGAAGDIVSTPSDLDAFFVALLGGELLPPELLAEMQTTVETAPELNGMRYGLALFSTPLSCGGVAWGHGGSIPGTRPAAASGRTAGR